MKKHLQSYIRVLLTVAAASVFAWGIHAQQAGLRSTSSPASVPMRGHPIDAMLRQMLLATVRISVSTENGFRHIGSGFVVSEDGYIITARHVADQQAQYLAIFGDGAVLEAKVVHVSTFTDCAVLKVERCGLAIATLREKDVFLGENVFVMGSPVDELFENYVTHGIVSQPDIRLLAISIADLFMLDAAVNPGNSGGPVFDDFGHVVGMVVALVPGAEGMGYAVKAVDIIDALAKAKAIFEADKG